MLVGECTSLRGTQGKQSRQRPARMPLASSAAALQPLWRMLKIERAIRLQTRPKLTRYIPSGRARLASPFLQSNSNSRHCAGLVMSAQAEGGASTAQAQPVDQSYAERMLKFINYAWTPYHAVGACFTNTGISDASTDRCPAHLLVRMHAPKRWTSAAWPRDPALKKSCASSSLAVQRQ